MTFPTVNKADTKTKIILMALFAIFSLFLISYFLIIPTEKKVKKIGQDILAQKIALEKRYNERDINRKNKNNLEIIKEKTKYIDEVFINENRELEFITTLEGIAADNGVAQKISLDPAASGAGEYKKAPLKLTLSGAARNILNYLISLEALSYYINIESLNIISSQKAILDSENASGDITMNISAVTYWK